MPIMNLTGDIILEIHTTMALPITFIAARLAHSMLTTMMVLMSKLKLMHTMNLIGDIILEIHTTMALLITFTVERPAHTM